MNPTPEKIVATTLNEQAGETFLERHHREIREERERIEIAVRELRQPVYALLRDRWPETWPVDSAIDDPMIGAYLDLAQHVLTRGDDAALVFETIVADYARNTGEARLDRRQVFWLGLNVAGAWNVRRQMAGAL